MDAGTAGVDIDSYGVIDINSLFAGAGSIALNATNSGGLDINIGSSGVTLDTDGILSLDSADNTNLTMTANSASGKSLDIYSINDHVSGTAGIDIDADDSISIGTNKDPANIYIGHSSNTGTCHLRNQNVSIISGGTASNSISIDASNAAGGITLDAGTNGITLEALTRIAAKNELRFYQTNNTQYVGFEAPDGMVSSQVYVLPTADGASGQVLSTNGSGVLSWIHN